MKHRILLLSLFPTLTLLNAGCSRAGIQQAGLREQQTTRELLDLKLKCAELGRHFDTDFASDLRRDGSLRLASRFAYNAKLNTCIYRGGSKFKSFSGHFIVDLATNEELASYTTDSSDAGGTRGEQRKFAQRELELFGSAPD